MIKKYNLALTLATKSKDVIEIAQYFSNISDEYLLGENSLPHVTLCQFETGEKEIDRIWENARNALAKESIDLEFKLFSCITFDNNIYWVSLLPNQGDALNQMHSIVANILKLPIRNAYDPHMTLINTKNKDYEKNVDKFSKLYVPINDTFVLTLGKCDQVGQLTEVIYVTDSYDL